MLWHIRIEPAPSLPDSLGASPGCPSRRVGPGRPVVRKDEPRVSGRGRNLARAARASGRHGVSSTRSSRSIESSRCNAPDEGPGSVIHVMPKPGVTDPEGSSALELLCHLGYPVSNVRTIKTYRVLGPADSLPRFIAARAGERRRRADGARNARTRPARRRSNLSFPARLGSDP